jgi:hypothetical protein
MDLKKIQDKLNEINQRKNSGEKKERVPTEYDNYKWKPTEPKTNIRILPNLHCLEVPIPQLGFYYINKRTYLAPLNFGNPDPVFDAYENFMPKTKLPLDEWKALKNQQRALQVQPRYFAYVLVRGKENEGVKIWEFSKTIFTKLNDVLLDTENYGDDITDLKTGRDIIVTFKPAEKDGEFPKVDVMPSGRETPVSTDPEILAKIKAMPSLDRFFKEASYDELKTAVDQHFASLQPTSNVESVPVKNDAPKTADAEPDPFASYTAPTVTTKSNPDAVAAVDAEFAALLDGLKL